MAAGRRGRPARGPAARAPQEVPAERGRRQEGGPPAGRGAVLRAQHRAGAPGREGRQRAGLHRGPVRRQAGRLRVGAAGGGARGAARGGLDGRAAPRGGRCAAQRARARAGGGRRVGAGRAAGADHRRLVSVESRRRGGRPGLRGLPAVAGPARGLAALDLQALHAPLPAPAPEAPGAGAAAPRPGHGRLQVPRGPVGGAVACVGVARVLVGVAAQRGDVAAPAGPARGRAPHLGLAAQLRAGGPGGGVRGRAAMRPAAAPGGRGPGGRGRGRRRPPLAHALSGPAAGGRASMTANSAAVPGVLLRCPPAPAPLATPPRLTQATGRERLGCGSSDSLPAAVTLPAPYAVHHALSILRLPFLLLCSSVANSSERLAERAKPHSGN